MEHAARFARLIFRAVPREGERSVWPALAVLAVTAVAAIVLFRYGLYISYLIGRQPDHWHGPVLFTLAAILGVHAAANLSRWERSNASDTLGVALVGIALLGGLAGTYGLFDQLVYLSMTAFASAMVLLYFGSAALVRAVPMLAAMALAFPLPRFVREWIAAPLADILGEAVVLVLSAGGTLALRDGAAIETVPATIAMENALPGIFLLGLALLVAVAFIGSGSPLRRIGRGAGAFLGLQIGFACFLLLLIGFYHLRPPSARVSAIPAALATVPVAFAWLFFVMIRRSDAVRGAAGWVGFWRALQGGTRPAFIAVLALSVAGAFVSIAANKAIAAPERVSLSFFPPDLDRWSSSRSALDPGIEAVLQADDYLLANYYSPDVPAPVEFFVAYYDFQSRDHGSIHSPEVCLPNDGWRIDRRSAEVLQLGIPAFDPLPVNRLVIRKDGQTAIVRYWFEGRGKRFASEFRARLDTRLDMLRKRRTDGGLIRFTTTLLPGESEAQADRRLQALMTAVVPHLPRFVPH